MTLHDLELYECEFLENFAGFRRFGMQQQLICASLSHAYLNLSISWLSCDRN